MRIKRWAFTHDISLWQRGPCYEATSADEYKEPVEVYLGLSFKKRPTGERSMFFGSYLYDVREVWVDL